MSIATYDAVVIGGGFAGLACAQALARNGLKTMVMEKKSWPGTKTHTTGIIVKELAEAWNLPSRLYKKISGVRIYSPEMESLDLYSPDYYFLATDTPALLRWHAEQAIQTGTTIRYNCHYRGSTRKDSYHHLGNANIRCRYLVGCDGSQSRVAADHVLGRNKQFLIGVEADFKTIPNLSASHLHVFLDNDIASGYIAWMVPGVHVSQVGLATRLPLIPSLDRFLEKLAPYWAIDKRDILTTRSGLIPCGGPVSPFYSEDVILLGDAAGMVSPLTAGGIHPAVNTGSYAGELIADYLLYHGNNPGRVLEQELPRYFFKHSLRHAFNHLPLANPLYNVVIGTSIFRLIAQTIFFHNRGIFSAAAWRDIFKVIRES